MATVTGDGIAIGTGTAVGVPQVNNTWTTNTFGLAVGSTFTGRARSTLAYIGGLAYIVGGRSGTTVPNGAVIVYDPLTDTSSAGPVTLVVSNSSNLGEARHMAQGAHVGDGRIVWAGGNFATNTAWNETWEWIPALDNVVRSRTQNPFITTTLTNNPGAGYNNKLYVSDFTTGALYEFDAPFNTWTAKATMPGGGRSGMFMAFGSDGNLHCIGGYSSSPITTHSVWNPRTNAWSTAAALPTGRGYGACAVKGSQIFCLGGVMSATNYATVEVFDCITGTWTTKPNMPSTRMENMAFVHQNYLFSVGGSTSAGATPNMVIYRLEIPETPNSGVAIGQGIAVAGPEGRGRAIGTGITTADGAVTTLGKKIRPGPIPVASPVP